MVGSLSPSQSAAPSSGGGMGSSEMPTVPRGGANCPPGWTPVGSSCYNAVSAVSTAADCQSECSDVGATLPCIMNAEQNAFLAGLAYASTASSAPWIGLSTTSTGTTPQAASWDADCFSTFTNITEQAYQPQRFVVTSNGGWRPAYYQQQDLLLML